MSKYIQLLISELSISKFYTYKLVWMKLQIIKKIDNILNSLFLGKSPRSVQMSEGKQ